MVARTAEAEALAWPTDGDRIRRGAVVRGGSGTLGLCVQSSSRLRSSGSVFTLSQSICMRTFDQEEWAEYSDHAPIIATFEADSPGSEG